MPFSMKIQPIDCNTPEGSFRSDPVKPIVKSRFKRLFERQFQSVLKSSSSEKPAASEQQFNKDGSGDLEPSSVCLAKMVQNFIEESNEKHKCGRNRCNCFNANCNGSSDDELDFFGGFSDSVGAPPPPGDSSDVLKNLVSCLNSTERNILTETSKIVEKNKICIPKDDFRKVVTEGLVDLGFDASICKSRWEKSPSYPAGEYEYIDVIAEGGERFIIDIDFRSEFEIARSTKKYRAILQSLPLIFVGKSDRLQQIVSIVSEAAKQSLKKKGMHFPPWRKAEYMRAKWLSSFTRSATPILLSPKETPLQLQAIEVKAMEETEAKKSSSISIKCGVSNLTNNFSGEFEMIFGEEEEEKSSSSLNSPVGSDSGELVSKSGDNEKIKVVLSPWQPPAIKPKSLQRGAKIVTGLASILKDKP